MGNAHEQGWIWLILCTLQIDKSAQALMTEVDGDRIVLSNISHDADRADLF
jgi:hypothetical protein